MMNQYAISTALFSSSKPDVFDKIAAAGFREIELSGSSAMMQEWLCNLVVLARLVAASGLTIRSIHTPDHAWHNGALDDETRSASVAAVETTFQQAAELGAEYVIVHPNRRSEQPSGDYKAIWQRSRESLVYLADRAKRFGIKMAVENMPWRDQSIFAPDRTMPGASVPQIIELIRGLGDHVGVCLDVGHSNAVGLSAAQEALDGGARLFCLHIQDNDGLGQDQHLLPGEGTINWPDFLMALETIHFAGMRTFEVLRGHEPALLLQGMADLAKQWTG